MRRFDRILKVLILFGAFALSTWFALQFGSGGLWKGIETAHAVDKRTGAKEKYDLTRLEAVTATIQTIRDKYVDPTRVKPRDMLLSALNYVQKDIPQVIVLREEGAQEVTVRVGPTPKSSASTTSRAPGTSPLTCARSSPSCRTTCATAPRSICARSSTPPAMACSAPSIPTRSS